MDDRLEVVAIQVGHEGAVVAGVVFGVQPGSTAVRGARGQRRDVERINGCAVGRGERDVCVVVGRFAGIEPQVGLGRVAKPDPECLIDADGVAERRESVAVEGRAARQVADPDAHVVNSHEPTLAPATGDG